MQDTAVRNSLYATNAGLNQGGAQKLHVDGKCHHTTGHNAVITDTTVNKAAGRQRLLGGVSG